MHGAGLSHVMFLPRQVTKVALVEVYNTMDEFCFKVSGGCGCVSVWGFFLRVF